MISLASRPRNSAMALLTNANRASEDRRLISPGAPFSMCPVPVLAISAVGVPRD